MRRNDIFQPSWVPFEAGKEGYCVYLACCANGTLYVGSTSDLERRLAAHNAGQGGRYTRRNRPLILLAAWSFPTRSLARQAERSLKQKSPEQKLQLVEQFPLSSVRRQGA
jgi:putative endonuclease